MAPAPLTHCKFSAFYTTIGAPEHLPEINGPITSRGECADAITDVNGFSLQGASGCLTQLREKERGYVNVIFPPAESLPNTVELVWEIEETFGGYKVMAKMFVKGMYGSQVLVSISVKHGSCIYQALVSAMASVLTTAKGLDYSPAVIAGAVNYVEDYMDESLIDFLRERSRDKSINNVGRITNTGLSYNAITGKSTKWIKY
jgi:hypothetical protein